MKNEPLSWEEFRQRDDIIGGTLEVFDAAESEPRPDLDRQYRGIIERVEWNKHGFPIFHLKSPNHFDFNRGQWLDGGLKKIEFLTILGPHHTRIYRSGEFLFIPGVGRYLIIPLGTEVPTQPVLQPVSCQDIQDILAALTRTQVH